FSGVSPSTSLRGSMIAVSAVPSSWPGSGSCSRMPLTLSSALSPSSSLATSSADASAGRRLSKGTMPTSAQARCLARTYTSEHAAGLDGGDHSLAEGGVHDVLAEAKADRGRHLAGA